MCDALGHWQARWSLPFTWSGTGQQCLKCLGEHLCMSSALQNGSIVIAFFTKRDDQDGLRVS